jgi:hypothetical protein
MIPLLITMVAFGNGAASGEGKTLAPVRTRSAANADAQQAAKPKTARAAIF